MKRFVATLTVWAVMMGPLGGPAPVFAARFIAPLANPGKAMSLPVSPAMTPGGNAALESFRDLGVISLGTSLPQTGAQAAATASKVVATPSVVGTETPSLAVSAQLSLERAPRKQTEIRETMRKKLTHIGQTAIPDQKGRTGRQNHRDSRSAAFRLFDGMRSNVTRSIDDDPASPVSARMSSPRSPLRTLLTTPVSRLFSAETWSSRTRAPPAPRAKTRFDKDEFGGPQPLALKSPEKTRRLAGMRHRLGTLKNHVFYGAKWALNMMGITTLVSMAIKPLSSIFPWQPYVSDSFLNLTGRVELLTQIGQNGIIDAVTTNPLSFLFVDMPLMVGMEELTFRLATFGLWFLALASVKPILTRVSGLLKDLPNLFGIPSIGLAAAGVLARVSRFAYPLAMLLSSFGFATAHLAVWGFNPATFAVHLTLGMTLAHVAYRTRGIVAPFFAHFLFNLGTITVGVLLPLTLMPSNAAVVMSLSSVFSVAFLWYNFRLHRIAKARAFAEARGAIAPTAPKSLWRRVFMLAISVPILLGAFHLFTPTGTGILRPEGRQAGPVIVEEVGRIPDSQGTTILKTASQPAKSELSAVAITQQAKPAIVMVRTEKGMGTGFIIDSAGLLVTNAHVVSVAVENTASGPKISRKHFDTVKIRFSNGREVPGKVVGYNKDKDIALIALPENPFGWPTVELGESSQLLEGEQVLAMGHPRGLPFSVSKGIISGLDFRNNGFVGFVQHDASVNPGNSGGPLFNMKGEVVGINSLIMSLGGGFDGISYAISSADLKKALAQFRKVNNIDTAWLGAIFYPGNPDAPRYGLYLDAVRPGSPAEKAGLRPGDILLSIDANKLANDPSQAIAQVSMALRSKVPSDTVEVSVARDGGVRTLTLTLGRR